MRKGPHYVEDRKVSTTFSARQSLVKRARASNIDVSAVCSSALEMALGKDPEEIELEKLGTAILRKKEELAPMEARHEQLKESVERKRRLQLDLKLEEDCGAWYLRLLLQDNRIQVVRPAVRDLETFLRHLQEEFPEFRGARLEGSLLSLNEPPSPKTHSLLKRKGFVSAGRNTYQWVEKPPAIYPAEQECASRFRISFNSRGLLEDMVSGNLSEIMPVAAFRTYSPRILSEDVKREIKGRMLSEYVRVEVSTG